MKLKQTQQCKTCPWKKSATVADIPNYSLSQHKKLITTISSGDISEIGSPIKVMACHKSAEGNEFECIGWLNHQLGYGNNIALRMMMLNCENARDIQIDCEQKETFEETFE